MNKNDIAWEKLFLKYNILNIINNTGFYIIKSDQIKEFREPRLMTKFDHKINLPKIFIENNLSILPITRGDYIISSFSAYKNFEDIYNNNQKVYIPANIQSLMPQFIISESIALNCACACGIINDFIEEDIIWPTVSGRMGSGTFSFNINTTANIFNINVNNSQIEIDAAYEGIESLSIIEAKMDLSDDFLIRQLYYPFRTWANKISKPINTIFMIFSNGVFNLFSYRFNDIFNYNSIELIKQKNYIISTNITLNDIYSILKNVNIIPEPNLPFPQADKMDRIINLIELLNRWPMTKQDITSEYEFDDRQTNYYTDAGRYLNLIEKYTENNTIWFKLSNLGTYIMSLPYRERQLSIISQILSHFVFNNVLNIYLQNGELPTKNIIINIMKSSNLFNIEAESTYYRRTSTIISWINWILSKVDLTD